MLSKHRPLNSRQYVKTRSRSLSRCLTYHDHHKYCSLFHFCKSIEKRFRSFESIDQKRQSVFFIPHRQKTRERIAAFSCFFRLSKNCCFQMEKTAVLLSNIEKLRHFIKKSRISEQIKEFFQLQFASFFKFMAAYLSLTHPVTRAKPRWCV